MINYYSIQGFSLFLFFIEEQSVCYIDTLFVNTQSVIWKRFYADTKLKPLHSINVLNGSTEKKKTKNCLKLRDILVEIGFVAKLIIDITVDFN